MNNILELIDTNIDIESPYKYENDSVPRVTQILSSMLYEDFIPIWANRIGRYQRKDYKATLDDAANIGTYTHEAIDNYIKSGILLDESKIPLSYLNNVKNAFNSFLYWWDIIKTNDYEILENEYTVICKYFGGTLDLLIKINGKIYLVDFKTSNHPSYKYTLQLSAYMYILRELYNIKVDGCIILMLDKKEVKFTEIIYNLDVKENIDYFEQCERTFLSLVYAYYNRVHLEYLYNHNLH